MKRRRAKRTAVISATTVTILLAGAAMALGGGFLGLIILPAPADDADDKRQSAMFDFRFDDNSLLLSGQEGPNQPPCENVDSYRVWAWDYSSGDTEQVPDDRVSVTPDTDDPWQGSFELTDVEGGSYLFEVVCSDDLTMRSAQDSGDGTGPGPYVGEFGFARLLVEVKVQGDAPDDATFEVQVACHAPIAGTEPTLILANDATASDSEEPDFEVTQSFGAAGGAQPVVLYEGGGDFLVFGVEFDPTVGDIPAECTVTQTDDGGAEGTTSTPPANSPVTVDITDLDDYTVTFTNTFPTEVEEEEEEEPVEVEDEAEPAEPVEEEPDFTG